MDSNLDQFKAAIKNVLDDCIVRNLEVDLLTDESHGLHHNPEKFKSNVWQQCQLVCSITDLLENLRESRFFGDILMTRFEKEVVYRSNFIHTLFKYIELQYGGVDLS